MMASTSASLASHQGKPFTKIVWEEPPSSQQQQHRQRPQQQQQQQQNHKNGRLNGGGPVRSKHAAEPLNGGGPIRGHHQKGHLIAGPTKFGEDKPPIFTDMRKQLEYQRKQVGSLKLLRAEDEGYKQWLTSFPFPYTFHNSNSKPKLKGS
jgi:hypothetical protein